MASMAIGITRDLFARSRMAVAVALCLALGDSGPALNAATKAARAKPSSRTKAAPAPVPFESLAQPAISWLFPAGGRRGTEVQVTIGGTNLIAAASAGNPDPIRVTGKGVTARWAGATESGHIRVVFAIAEDAELGEREVRFVNHAGASNRLRFVVSELPETGELEPNSSKDLAQSLDALPVVVNGRLAAGDRDFFRVHARAGQNLICALDARALKPYLPDTVPAWFDPTLILYDANGRRAMVEDDFHFSPDPILTFQSLVDADYLIEVIDVLQRGREDFVYRLRVGELPFLNQVFPLGGPRGTNTAANLYGLNLTNEVLAIAVASNAPPRQLLRAASPAGLSNPLPFAAGDGPEVTEREPNSLVREAMRLVPPVTVNGLIQTNDDTDYFVFRAAGGERLVIDVLARRLGSPLDAQLTLFDARGQQLAQSDDFTDPFEPLLTHHTDAHLEYTFPSANNYLLRLTDAQGLGSPVHGYRLVLAPPQPAFALRVWPDNPCLPQGGSAVLSVRAIRRDGFHDDIYLSVTNLPPGFAASHAVLAVGRDEARVTITAPAEAVPGPVSPVIQGRLPDGWCVDAEPAEAVRDSQGGLHVLPSAEFLMTVIEPAPLQLSTTLPADSILALPQSNAVELVVRVLRRDGVKGEVTVEGLNPPPGITITPALIPGNRAEGVVTLTATQPAAVGAYHQLAMQGVLRSGKTNLSVSLPALTVRVLPPEIP